MPENRGVHWGPAFVGAFLVGLLTFAGYVLVATPVAYPLDSGELATAAFGLGVAHPPGEETTLLLGKLFTLQPLGSVAFKVALSQAAAGAMAAVLVFLLVLEATRGLTILGNFLGNSQHPSHPGAAVGVAAAAALAFAFAPGVVIVSNRAEVYATQTALSLGALWLALRARAAVDARHAFLAAMLIGFGVGNHSMVAGMVGLGAVVAAMPLLVGRPARKRLIVLSVAAFAVGLCVHAYLPMRAGALFAASDRGIENILWGDPRTWRGFWWLVSAKTFAEKVAVVHGNASPWDLPFLPIEELGTVYALLAPAGVYFLLRRRETRVVGLALIVGATGSMVAALFGGLDPENPDIRGYLGPAIALIAACSGVAITVGLAAFRVPQLRAVLVVLFLLGALSRFPFDAEYPNLRHARAASCEVGEMIAELPTRAALLTYHFETGFLTAYHRLVEGARPDVAWAHAAFAGDSGYARRVSEAEPDLRAVMAAHREPAMLAEAMAKLDAIRPLRIEPNFAAPPELRVGLGPAGDLWAMSSRVSSEPMRPLSSWMVTEAAHNRQTRGYLAWRNFIDAAWSCELGFAERARERFAELERLVPSDERFLDLRKKCAATTAR